MKRLLALVPLAVLALPSLQAEQLTALTTNNELIFVDHATPGTVVRKMAITGLDAEFLIGIDYRPANGELYGLSNASRLYRINLETSRAEAIGTAGAFVLTGTRFGFNFNPTVDRIRVVSDADQNLRLNPNDGTLTLADGPLAYRVGDPNAGANPNVVACAYTNSFAGSAGTVLYDLDSTLNTLAVQAPPNNGTLVTVGSLGVDTTENVGFDISGATGRAYAAFTVGSAVSLYTIDLATGASTSLGVIADAASLNGATVRAIAVATPSRLVNLASRGRVGGPGDELIGGFVARGAAGTRVLFRAIGPSLGTFGVPDPLADPTIEVFDNLGMPVGANDDWQDAQGALITGTGLAPTNAAESALLVTLKPGAYTVVVRGKGGNTGVAVVEAYELP